MSECRPKPVYDAYAVGDRKTRKEKLSGSEELKPLMYKVRHTLSWSFPKESEDSAFCVRIQKTNLKQHRPVSLV